ncbi:hypothetical protein SAMN05444172_3848 [Burkholderia sp. GAS332]|nr:hypothetical protein SAMN05444172_3848 [Burkholderia sp. GAS332]
MRTWRGSVRQVVDPVGRESFATLEHMEENCLMVVEDDAGSLALELEFEVPQM